MPIKAIISEADYSELSDTIKTIYKKGSVGYELDLEGSSTPASKKSDAELKRALDRERQKKKELQDKLDIYEAEREEGSLTDLKKKGDIELLEKSWNEKLAKSKQETKAILEQKNKFIEQQLVDTVASNMARALSSRDHEIILPHIKARLVADLDAETPTTRVKDMSGNLSALTLDDLKAEFVANPVFAPIITASKASGGNGVLPTRNGVTNPTVNVDLSKLGAKELGALVKSKVDSQT